MKIIGQGIIFESKSGSNRQSLCFPGISVLSSGRWLCSCRAAPAKKGTAGQHVIVSWSDDEGASWSRSVEPFKPSVVEGKAGLFRGLYTTPLGGRRVLGALLWVDHSNPALDFFNEKTEGLLDTRIFTTISQDGGKTWGRPRFADTYPIRKPLPLTGPILITSEGKWACQFEVNKHYDDPRPWRHASMLMYSSDRGLTWSEFVVVANDPANRFFYWDQRPAYISKNRILDLFWTFDNRKAVYLNIHARESLDNGRTWSELWDTGVPGQPAAPVPLKGGRIAMVYMDRTGVPTVKARISSDGGRSWSAKTAMTLFNPSTAGQTRNKSTMKDAWSEMAKFSTGLPSTALLPNGDFLVVFYTGPEPDKTDIRWIRVRP
jgi:hypothetical protein